MNKLIPLLLALVLAACSQDQQEAPAKSGSQEPPMAVQIPLEQKQQNPFTSISAQMAQQLITTKANLLILDTRTTREILTNGAIAGSQQASLRAIFQDELTIPKDTPILVVCAVGGRSYAAGKIMVKNGFQEIYNLSGGLDEWKRAGLPVIYPQQ